MADRVQLFHTCLVNEIDPAVGFAVARVLERAGCDVDVPRDQTCCGQPAYNAGFHDEARDVARHTIDVLSRAAAGHPIDPCSRPEGPIVTPSVWCADLLVHKYPRLFEDDAAMRERALAV